LQEASALVRPVLTSMALGGLYLLSIGLLKRVQNPEEYQSTELTETSLPQAA
jgi:hypothetical protein